MKTIFKTTLVIAFLCAVMDSYGTSEYNALVENTVFASEKGRQIIIKNQSGKVIHQEVVHGNDIAVQNFDLSLLNDGVYTIEVDSDIEISTKKFVVVNNKVTFLKNTEEKCYKPIMRLNNKRIFISQLALHSEEELEIKIYFEDELIHAETASGDKILNRIYHLKEDVSGEYTVLMKHYNRTYRESFKI